MRIIALSNIGVRFLARKNRTKERESRTEGRINKLYEELLKFKKVKLDNPNEDYKGKLIEMKQELEKSKKQFKILELSYEERMEEILKEQKSKLQEYVTIVKSQADKIKQYNGMLL